AQRAAAGCPARCTRCPRPIRAGTYPAGPCAARRTAGGVRAAAAAVPGGCPRRQSAEAASNRGQAGYSAPATLLVQVFAAARGGGVLQLETAHGYAVGGATVDTQPAANAGGLVDQHRGALVPALSLNQRRLVEGVGRGVLQWNHANAAVRTDVDAAAAQDALGAIDEDVHLALIAADGLCV